MRRKGVVFSKMFVLRSMGNELVPSPLYTAPYDKINHGLKLVNLSSNCDVKSGLRKTKAYMVIFRRKKKK